MQSESLPKVRATAGPYNVSFLSICIEELGKVLLVGQKVDYADVFVLLFVVSLVPYIESTLEHIPMALFSSE